MVRVSVAMRPVPMVIAGRIRLLIPSVSPADGNHPSCSENRIISISPSQKFGIDRPSSAATILALSVRLPCLRAAMMPRGMERMIETSTDAPASFSVEGSRCMYRSHTGALYT